MRSRIVTFLLAVTCALAVYAGSTGTTALHMPQGENSSRPFGDFVSDNDAGALNTHYSYFIEVPPGITRLHVDLFDADVGDGDPDPGQRDRNRGSWNTPATYSLRDPSGNVVTTTFTTGNNTGPTGSDNAWLTFYDATGNDVADNFGTTGAAAYTNNDGNNNWSTNWVENDNGSPSTGAIFVTGGRLQVGDNQPGTPDIYREADLLGTPGLNMNVAYLSLSFASVGNLETTDCVAVQISGNGGGSYTELDEFCNDSSGTRTYNITPYIANNTRVRFIKTNDMNANEHFAFDNVRIYDGVKTAGHWELRVDMTTGGGSCINAIGMRANDGDNTSSGTELNIYADSMISLGVNPPASGTTDRDYTFYPWITGGCACSQNDFDLDTDSPTGDTGEATYTSRGGTFSQTFAATTLSGNDEWNHDDVTGWTTDADSVDYGIWTLAARISSYLTPALNGNYETTYVGAYNVAAGDPTSNPYAGTFRIYLPTDGAGAPSKPYLEQLLRYKNESGPNPPLVGQTTTYTVTLRVVNPAAQAITFSGTNLVTANIPGSGAVYGGSALVSQGSIVSEPSVGSTGNITWNPGTLAAGDTAILAYDVNATPTSSGQRIPVTATPTSGNGTRATYVDETGNTTQSRATYTLGGLCEMAVTEGLVTDVLLSSFNVTPYGGRTNVEWSTAAEVGTLAFNVYRADGSRVNDSPILPNRSGRYSIIDSLNADPDAVYTVEEIMASGKKRRYGPLNRFVPVGGPDRIARSPRVVAMPTAAPLSRSWHVESDARKAEKAAAAMVGVRETGIVQVPLADLAAQLGVDLKSVQKAIQKGQVSVTDRGTEIAWTPGRDSLLFFGQKSDSIYSNDHVYRIELTRGTTMSTISVPAGGGPTSTFTDVHDYENDDFAATTLPLDPEGDYWFWDFVLSDDPTYGQKTFDLDVPSVASSSGASVTVRFQGALRDATHHASVSLNGAPIGDATWSGVDAKSATFSIPAALLHDGLNEVAIDGNLDGGDSFDVFYVDGFSLQYQRAAIPQNNRIELTQGGSLTVGPFGSRPLILDVTNRARPKMLVGGSFAGGNASFVAPGVTKRVFLEDGFVNPSFIRPSEEPKSETAARADWVVIVPKALEGAAQSLADLHESEGLKTLIVPLEQIYDQFAGGNVDPHAIRDFIASTASWNRAPRYFVLGGGGTIDYRGIEVDPGLVPPLITSTEDGLFAADSLFADRDGDGLPDVAIGRIPIFSGAEIEAYATKLEANAGIDVSATPAVFSADAIDQSADFRAASLRAEQPLGSRPLTNVFMDDLGPAATRSGLINAWNSGTPLVSWTGHGGLDRLSAYSILSSTDAPSLTSSGPLPILVAMTCTINGFENGFVEPLGAALTRAPGAGAVAVWSASGLSFHGDADELQRTFMRLAAEQPGARVGDLILESLAAHPTQTASIYLLLGDPAIRLNLPKEAAHGGPHAPGE